MNIVLAVFAAFLFPASGVAYSGRIFKAYFSAFVLPFLLMLHVFLPLAENTALFFSLSGFVLIYIILSLVSLVCFTKERSAHYSKIFFPAVLSFVLISAAAGVISEKYEFRYIGDSSAYPLFSKGDVVLLEKKKASLGDLVYHNGIKRVVADNPAKIRFFGGRLYLFERELDLLEYDTSENIADVYYEKNTNILYPVYISSHDPLLKQRDDVYEIKKNELLICADNRSFSGISVIPAGEYLVVRGAVFSPVIGRIFKTAVLKHIFL
ncbi:MAG TPA: hypothetical protein PLA54_06445 [Spirochaetota bacterium]|nr:hypothetical protein [Spirochaetota bacterium]HQE58820.1 hypothetical protein [Spirochaetota bacterium]